MLNNKRVYNVGELVAFLYHTKYATTDSQYGRVKRIHDDYLIIKGEDKISYIIRYNKVEKIPFITNRQGDENS